MDIMAVQQLLPVLEHPCSLRVSLRLFSPVAHSVVRSVRTSLTDCHFALPKWILVVICSRRMPENHDAHMVEASVVSARETGTVSGVYYSETAGSPR